MTEGTCWLSKITPKQGLDYSQQVRLARLNPYAQHQEFWKLFNLPFRIKGDREERDDFLFRAEFSDGKPVFYLLSSVQPGDKQNIWDIKSKEYKPDIRKGDRLAFKLRANPVQLAKKERTNDEVDAWRVSRKERGLKEKMPTKKRIRHDVVMAAKIELGWHDIPADERPSLAHVAAETGAAWLRNRQADLGCEIDFDDLRVDGYRQHRLFKKNGDKPINFSTLDFTGILTVNEPNMFVKECLFTGIGPAKAFGCGLMLVRRV